MIESGVGTPNEPPPRPPMSDTTPAPVPPSPVPTGTLNAARHLWVVSFVLGLVAVAVAFLSRNAQIDEIQLIVTSFAPEQSDENLAAAAAIVYWGILSALVLVLVVEILLYQAMMRRHGSSRWVMVLVVAGQAGVVLLADGFFRSGPEGAIVRICALVQVSLAVIALLLSILPTSWGWFRRTPKPKPLS